jgi:hypothetical protein
LEEPIVVALTLSAVPVVVASVLFAPVTLTVPPRVALNAAFAPVELVSPPVKLIVPPVFVPRLMPRPLSVIPPLKATVLRSRGVEDSKAVGDSRQLSWMDPVRASFGDWSEQ